MLSGNSSDSDRSLEELQDWYWPDPPTSVALIDRICGLRKQPISSLTPGDLRLLIGQRIGLPYLIPLALELLSQDPFVETEYFEGDLLENVLLVDAPFLLEHESITQQIREIAEQALEHLPLTPETLYAIINTTLTERVTRFLSIWRG